MAESVKNAVVQTKKESVKFTIYNAVIKQVRSPSTIQRIAKDRGINPQEVFVRVTVAYGGTEARVSNKLRFLTKAGYLELIEAQKTGKPMKITIDVENEFFYIENDVSVDDLFKEELPKPDNKADLLKLMGTVIA